MAARIQTAVIPDLTLPLKPNAFRRLLGNILSNALRHGKNVRISGEERDERVWLYVDDDGPGIPASRREDVFRPFVRLDPARNLDKTGTGLGLAIALDIAHAHGGDIFLENSPMGGLRVAIKIPV
jgi:two-component system osmolarity sensor histidine kinase EnvZ